MFDIVNHQTFEITIMVLILLNMVSMMVESHDMSDKLQSVLEFTNYVFVALFSGEALLKVSS